MSRSWPALPRTPAERFAASVEEPCPALDETSWIAFLRRERSQV